MKKKMLAFVLLTFGLCTGCAKNVVTAPVPGSTGTPDATAFRVLADAQAALHSIKTWEQCAAAKFPQTIAIDGTVEPCDASAGTFPAAAVPLLNTAIQSYNDLEKLGQAFHAGTNTDQAGLQAAESKLSTDVTNVVTKAGGR